MHGSMGEERAIGPIAPYRSDRQGFKWFNINLRINEQNLHRSCGMRLTLHEKLTVIKYK